MYPLYKSSILETNPPPPISLARVAFRRSTTTAADALMALMVSIPPLSQIVL